ncbi:MAG: oligosaccharide flippase family protein, partial [Candidatus Eisenbacteria bacterium]|nr:oligosaccharide flippase family protein [Candidatus Eisenbacteria bacterium]
HSPPLVTVLRLIAVAIPLSAFTTVVVSAAQGLKLMRYQVLIRDTTEQGARLLLAAALLLAGLGLFAAAWALVVSLAIGALVSGVVRRRVVATRLRAEGSPIREWRSFLQYCWPVLPTNLIAVIEVWLTTFMVGSLLSSADVGVFSAAYRTVFLVQGILLSFNTVFSPLISGLWHQGDRDALARLLKTVSAWTLLVSLPPLLFMALVPGEIMSVFGEAYHDGSTVLVLLCLGQAIMSSTGSLGVMIDMSGRSRLTLLNAVPHLCVQVALSLAWIPRYGIAGAAYAKIMSTLLLRVLQLVEVHRFLGMHPFGRAYIRPAVAGASGLLCAGLITLISTGWAAPLRLAAVAGTLLLAYALGVVAQGLTQEERVLFMKLRKRLGL